MTAVSGAILYGFVMTSPILPWTAYWTFGPEPPPEAEAVPGRMQAAATAAAASFSVKDFMRKLLWIPGRGDESVVLSSGADVL